MRFLESDEEKIMITYTFMNLLISIILEQFHKKIQFKLRLENFNKKLILGFNDRVNRG